VPSIKFVWPFLARNLSINTVECARSNIVLLSAEMIPIGQYDSGPTMQAKSASACLSAVGVEHSPAFFALKPDSADAISVVEANNSDIESIISCSLHPEHTQEQPAVELAFMTSQEVLRVFPLHRRNCAEVAAEARARGMGPEYLSMPAGARGNLYVNGPVGRNEIALCSGCDASPHSKHMRLLPPDVQAQLSSALADPAYDVEIDFGGFGRLCLTSSHAEDIRRKLDSGLRNRLLSFMFQLRLGAPTAVYADDMALVEALAAIKPGQSLITHYRLLVREVLACGFKSKYFGQSVLP
jgi:hypothetical protein